MTIHIKPELEQLIQKDVERGPYQTMDEFVERAVHMLHEQEEWLSTNKAEVSARIEEGYAAARRGELIDSDRVRTEMEEKKRAWQADRRVE
jgi:Arc/MetJ-type ribon-helix-helix transcriptional regulator